MKNLPKCREIDSALTRRFTCVFGATGRRACVRAWVARAAAGPGQRTRGEMRACTTRQRPPTERERRIGSGPIPTAAERRRRGEVVEPGDATKAALCRGALRTLARSLVRRSSLISPQRARRARTTTAATRQ